MTPGEPEWAIAPEEVEAVRAHLGRHFPGGTVRALCEPTDPGQLFQVVDREGSRFTLKIMREALDELRVRQAIGAASPPPLPPAPGGAGRPTGRRPAASRRAGYREGGAGRAQPSRCTTALDEFLARQEITRRLRRSGRVIVRGIHGEDAIREERA